VLLEREDLKLGPDLDRWLFHAMWSACAGQDRGPKDYAAAQWRKLKPDDKRSIVALIQRQRRRIILDCWFGKWLELRSWEPLLDQEESQVFIHQEDPRWKACERRWRKELNSTGVPINSRGYWSFPASWPETRMR
jgi:hypothetical protein